MQEREVGDMINAVFDDGTASFVDSDGNFDGGVYGRLESVTTMTTG